MSIQRGLRLVFVLVLCAIGIMYTDQITMMISNRSLGTESSAWMYTGVPIHESVNGYVDRAAQPLLLRSAPSSYFPDNSSLLEEEFAKFRQRDSELNSHSASNSFSSCLLIMDENHRLTEWLAYHIFTLPLRHLVVANDPRSHSDPNRVFDKFRRLGVKIEVWNDADFGYNKYRPSAGRKGDIMKLTRIHRARQVIFYEKCSNYLKTQNRSWTTFHDVDEYIVLDKHYINNTETLLRQSGSVLKWLQGARQKKHAGIPAQYWQKDCITLSRTMYGTHPSNISDIEKHVPVFLNATKFETLAFRHHERHGASDVNGACKSLVDVQQVGTNEKYGVHVVMGRDHCGNMFVKEGPIAINHYVGSWEYFSYKNDSRGTRRDSWELKSRAGEVRNDDDIRPWIGGFVNHVGKHLAKYLLADVGYMAPRPQVA